MWNFNIKQGAIWSVKSLNEYEQCYTGMTFGETFIVLLSSYIDENNMEKITYLMVDKIQKEDFSLYVPTMINNKQYYINLDNIYTGDRRALNSFIQNVSEFELKEILDSIKLHFNFIEIKRKKQKSNKVDKKENINKIKNSIKIHKFGMDIIVVPSDNVNVSKSGRLSLSANVKSDILNGIDTNTISEKYKIYPEKAVRVIKSKLIYQFKHK